MSYEDQIAELRRELANLAYLTGAQDQKHTDQYWALGQRLDALEAHVLGQPIATTATTEPASWEPGPARVAFVVQVSDEFVPAIDRMIVSIEEMGGFVESVQHQSVGMDVYSALIVYRVRAQQDESSS